MRSSAYRWHGPRECLVQATLPQTVFFFFYKKVLECLLIPHTKGGNDKSAQSLLQKSPFCRALLQKSPTAMQSIFVVHFCKRECAIIPHSADGNAESAHWIAKSLLQKSSTQLRIISSDCAVSSAKEPYKNTFFSLQKGARRPTNPV